MKGSILGYVAIIAILIVSILSIYYFTQSTATSENVTTTEGLIVSSEDFNFFLLKTLNQSIEFIAQRSAYDLALNGGFEEGREVFWNYNYPQISDLEGSLANSIESNLPSSYKNFDKTVEFENTQITIGEQQPLSASTYFDVGGYTNISIYDETVRSQTSSNFNINSRATSSYFNLLYVAREILTNTKYNSSLNDANALTPILENDFPGLGFTITPSGDIVDITIEDLCYPTYAYCLAPLYPNEQETKKDTTTGQLIPYENLKLNFKVKAQQTGSTPSSCSFSISLNPAMGSAASGDEVDVPLNVISGTTNDAVTLNAKAYNKNTMAEDNTITVTFDDNGGPMPSNTLMRIKTDLSTLGGDYLINVTGDGCSPNQENFATYDLSVNPAMTFSISVDKDPVTLINNRGSYSNSTNAFVNKLTGVSQNVLLSVSGLPAGVSYSLSQNNMPPNFPSVLTLTTDGSTPQGDYTITIKGSGGGSYSEKQFTLHVEAPFDFSFYIQGIDHDDIFRTKSTSTTLAVKATSGTPEPVDFSYDVVNSLGNTDPSNYHITLLILPRPCTLTILNPNCYPVMVISTTQNTPTDTYAVHVNASATYVWHQVSFALTVKWGCGDGIVVAPEQCDDTDLGGSNLCTVRFPYPPGIGGSPVRGGTLTCGSNCLLNTSNCIYCGNNIVEPPEECDLNNDTQCPGSCKADCTCPTIFKWSCSNWISGNFPGNSANFVSPDCTAGWYPTSCLSENLYPLQSTDIGKYGEDVIQKIKIVGNHCLVMGLDTNGANEQGRGVCTLCTNKQPTILWGVNSVQGTAAAGGTIDNNGWFQLPAGMGPGFAYEIIDSQQCPSGMFPISCLADVNESLSGGKDALVDLFLDNNRCNASFRNDPNGGEREFSINVGIVCTNKDYGAPTWGGWQSSNIQVAFFASPICDVSGPNPLLASAFTESNRTRPTYYLEDALQTFEYSYEPSLSFFGTIVGARDTQGSSEHNRNIGILCVPPSA